jgi:anti-sigma regulatory factor (Ser/Thr protein kinase)
MGDVLLCVSEAVTNVVFHAYADEEEPGNVHVQAYVENDLCIVSEIRDEAWSLASIVRALPGDCADAAVGRCSIEPIRSARAPAATVPADGQRSDLR